MYRVAVVEDMPAEQDLLRRHLARYAEAAGMGLDVAFYSSGDDFLQAKKAFDLVFMDIEMPGLDGMECAHLWRSWAPEAPLVFVTNLASFALKGYEVDALGFLVKPVGWADFRRVMDKVRRSLELHDLSSVAVSAREGTYAVPVRSLVYVEVFGHDLLYHQSGSPEPLRGRGSLRKVEESLEGGPFFRISNSCIVNMDHVKRVSGNDLLMSNGDVLHFSRPRKREASQRIVAHMAGL